MAKKRRALGDDPATKLALETPRLGRGNGLELVARRVLEGLYAGRHRSPFHGTSIDFAEHRPYQAGDELRTIDWRAFARTDRLLIKRFHDDRQLPMALVLDTSASMAYGDPVKDQHAQLIAAALGLLALDQGDTVHVWAGHVKTKVAGPGGVVPLCTALTTTVSDGTMDMGQALLDCTHELRQRTLIVMISDLLCDCDIIAEAAATANARGHEVAVIHILDRSEIDLPAEWGRVILHDPEDKEPAVSCDAGSAKESFDAAMAIHLEHCHSALLGAGADYQQWCTDQNPVAMLGHWLERRRRR